MNPWKPGMVLVLNAERFILRSMRSQDVNDEYISWWNDPRIQAGLNHPVRGWGHNEAVKHVLRFDNRTRFHLGIYH